MTYKGKNADEFLAKRALVLEIKESGATPEEKKELRRKKKTVQKVQAFLDGLTGMARNKAVKL